MAQPINRLDRGIERLRELLNINAEMTRLQAASEEMYNMLTQHLLDYSSGIINQVQFTTGLERIQTNLENITRQLDTLREAGQALIEETLRDQQNGNRRPAVPVANTGCVGSGCTIMGGSRRRLRKTRKYRK